MIDSTVFPKSYDNLMTEKEQKELISFFNKRQAEVVDLARQGCREESIKLQKELHGFSVKLEREQGIFICYDFCTAPNEWALITEGDAELEFERQIDSWWNNLE